MVGTKWGFFHLSRSSRGVAEPPAQIVHRVAHNLVVVYRGVDLLHGVVDGGAVTLANGAPDLPGRVLGELLGQVHRDMPGLCDGPASALALQLAQLDAELLSGGLEDLVDAAGVGSLVGLKTAKHMPDKRGRDGLTD